MDYNRRQLNRKKHKAKYMDDAVGRKLEHKKRAIRKKQKHPYE